MKITTKQNAIRGAADMRKRAAKVLAGVAAAALTAGGLSAIATPAFAATSDTTNATFSWAVNAESGATAPFGGCNFLTAGTADPASSYTAQSGNVKITKPVGGKQVTVAQNTKCGANGGPSLNQVNFSGGTGKFDAAKNSADIKWSGSFTMAFYGGMIYWSVSNPHLVIKNGHGSLTGTFSGYGSSRENPGGKHELLSANGKVADFKKVKVDVAGSGIKITPDYKGVSNGRADQNKSVAGWGSFPKSWVDYNVKTGLSSYWYSSGGAADPNKSAQPMQFTYKALKKFSKAATPKISGTKKVGKTLKVKVGKWSPKPSYSYQWYANGKKINKATKSKLKLAKAQKGKKITVKATGKKAGYKTVVKTSKKTAKVKK